MENPEWCVWFHLPRIQFIDGIFPLLHTSLNFILVTCVVNVVTNFRFVHRLSLASAPALPESCLSVALLLLLLLTEPAPDCRCAKAHESHDAWRKTGHPKWRNTQPRSLDATSELWRWRTLKLAWHEVPHLLNMPICCILDLSCFGVSRNIQLRIWSCGIAGKTGSCLLTLEKIEAVQKIRFQVISG